MKNEWAEIESPGPKSPALQRRHISEMCITVNTFPLQSAEEEKQARNGQSLHHCRSRQSFFNWNTGFTFWLHSAQLRRAFERRDSVYSEGEKMSSVLYRATKQVLRCGCW